MATNPEYQRQYYLANKDRKRIAARERYAANPEKGREKARRNYHRRPDGAARSAIQSMEWDRKNPERVFFNAAKTRAKKRGLAFDISVEDIVFPEVCPVLGIPIQRCDRSAGPNSPSLDRIDSRKGYVKGNVWVISFLANRMKNSATPDELVAFAKAILKLFG